MRVLVVEDETKMAALLKQGLEEQNHSVEVTHDGRTALELASDYEFDVIVLDVMLPGLDGFEVARRLRKSQRQTPILMLTARDAIPDVAHGLDVGVDDYLTKPFAFPELLARIRALARRSPAALPAKLSVADLILDPGNRRVARGAQEIHLTATEYRLLEFMMRRLAGYWEGHRLLRRYGASTKTLKTTPWKHSSPLYETRSTVDSIKN